MTEEVFETFRGWIDNRHEYARAWKESTGNKVVGYFCTYVPEEILYAANILPVRILGSHEPPTVTEPYIFAMFCHLCRDCLAQGLRGKFSYLDGIVEGQSCLHLRQTFNAWRLHIPIDFAYYIHVPHAVQNPHAIPYLTQEFAKFKKAVEKWTGRRITDGDLDKGIKIVNRNRELMRKIYDYRKLDNPKITGLEAMEMVLSSQMVDKEEHSKKLEKLLQELPNRRLDRNSGIRLMIIGSEDDDRVFMKNVEDLGATFVIDEHCTGSRYIWDDVAPNEDRLFAIASRYVNRIPCPSKDAPEFIRIRHAVSLAREFKAQGAFVIQNKFCDPHGIEIPPLREALKSAGVETYPLEFDVTVPWGQFRTRVEAFLETLTGLEELF
ncbi:MAG: 2-hydroxyacyl-CoA dehydratase [Nitrososphaerota archaeon]|nr:2-hydroxyacyl-CoA dehydratase [Candidatus Bathyarchaeota archaeon]MDW8023411.1 2-hydroxyacyl-CoA dehydratase [Nitrososphaerota archaeon]